MSYDIVKVKKVRNYELLLTFEDGAEGIVDIKQLVPFEGVFAKLSDLQYFNTVKLDKELGTICWDNGADISPSFLYEHIEKNAA